MTQARDRLAQNPELREHPTNLLESMLLTRDLPNSGFTDEDVRGNVMTMLLAGEDTTANSLAWTIHLLHQNPAATRRAQEDVDAGLAADEVASELDQLEKLDYVEACAAEAMRMYPVAPLIGLEALHDTVVGDVAVPKGTQIMVQSRSGAMDPTHFEDPDRYRPERWVAGEWRAHLSSAHRTVMPFGAGPRMCPGRYLALVEMKMLLRISS